MKSLFRGHFNHTDAEFTKLWNESVVSFDTNVLLDLYRYQRSTADTFLLVVKKLAEAKRLWLPYQTVNEFFRHRQQEIIRQFAEYETVSKYLGEIPNKFAAEFPRHSHLPVDDYRRRLEAVAAEIKKDAEKVHKGHTDVSNTNSDPTIKALAEAFKGRVGPKPTNDEYRRLVDECQRRFDEGLPPTTAESKDAKKPADTRFGDAIIWLQLLGHCKESNKPLILVTAERKGDWWYRIDARTLGPKPELVQEFFEVTNGALFHLYSTAMFLEHAVKHFGISSKPEVLKDAQAVADQRSDETLIAPRIRRTLASPACELLKFDIEDYKDGLQGWLDSVADCRRRYQQAGGAANKTARKMMLISVLTHINHLTDRYNNLEIDYDKLSARAEEGSCGILIRTLTRCKKTMKASYYKLHAMRSGLEEDLIDSSES